MKCRRCRGKAVIDLPRHNSAFCPDCFIAYFNKQVDVAIAKQEMFFDGETVLVAVSGGKDSLALWDILLNQGVETAGVYVDLGIEEYSATSKQIVEAFATSRGAHLLVVDVREECGFSIREVAKHTMRTACSACGLFKRYLINKIAVDQGFQVVATGHNLDDEASSLLGNVLHWKEGFLARQSPALPSTHPKLARKVKPLFRLTERETAAYCILRNIQYMVEECPLVRGSTNLMNKQALNLLEQSSPGTKHAFYFDFLRKRQNFRADEFVLSSCEHCGQATTAQTCSFCRLVAEVRAKTCPPAAANQDVRQNPL